jgi:hypothetical protein
MDSLNNLRFIGYNREQNVHEGLESGLLLAQALHLDVLHDVGQVNDVDGPYHPQQGLPELVGGLLGQLQVLKQVLGDALKQVLALQLTLPGPTSAKKPKYTSTIERALLV